MKKTIQHLGLLFSLLFSINGFSQIVYVAAGANGSGTSWADAMGDLKTALDNALPITQVWVKEGTYFPVTCSNCDFNHRNASFSIKNGVKIFGGFAGTENDIDQRDINAHPTYLSGDIDQDGSLANNSFSVVHTFNVSNLTEVDGFIITNGNATDNNFPVGSKENSGGGWFNTGSTNGFSSHPVVRNCRFENNHAWAFGGAMMNDGSFTGSCSPVYFDCTFKNNTSRAGGGAIYNSGSFNGNCSPGFIDCIFENNECTEVDGGAVFNIGSENGVSNPNFTNCQFLLNRAAREGGAVYSFGKNGNSSPDFIDCVFDNNEGKEGGAIYNDGTFGGFSGGGITACHFINNHTSDGDGGAIYNSGFLGTCNPQLMNCIFENNTSAFAGGAIFNNGVEGVCNPAIVNCRFIKNVAITFGGGMYNQGKTGNASPTVTNCIFSENTALSAAGIYNLGSEQGNANAVITNCTFYRNNANVCGGVYCNAGEDTSGISSPSLVNCIFWENTANDIGDIFRIINGTPTISYSLVDKIDCNDLYNGNGGILNCNDGMIFNEDPKFVSPESGNFHLDSSSPAIDFGLNEGVTQTGIDVDLDNLPRIFNTTVDMGVFEYGSSVGTAPTIMQHPTNQEACENEMVTFSISATGTAPLAFQWFKNNQPMPGEENEQLMIQNVTGADEGNYSCQVTNGLGEQITSNEAELTVNAIQEVSLSISTSDTNICEGDEITLTANPSNEGIAPLYQWYINGNAFGGSVQSFNISAINHGDTFFCIVTSSASCVSNSSATSNVVTIGVESYVSASLSIAPDVAMPCEGHSMSFVAVPVNGGFTPSYEWSVNGSPTGDNSPFLNFIPIQGDLVHCTMVSSENCVTVNPVQSEIFEVELTVNESASIVISPSEDSTFCLGTEVIFTAVTEHEGDLPVYEWQINGNVAGANEPMFISDELEDGDVVRVFLTTSLSCVEENPVLSNLVEVSVDSCIVPTKEQFVADSKLLLYPNPSDGRIFVEISELSGNFTIRLLNTHGQILMSKFIEHPFNTLVKQEFDLLHFPQGVYYFQIITDYSLTAEKIIVN